MSKYCTHNLYIYAFSLQAEKKIQLIRNEYFLCDVNKLGSTEAHLLSGLDTLLRTLDSPVKIQTRSVNIITIMFSVKSIQNLLFT